MKVAYVTPYDSRSLQGRKEWSGLGYYIAQSLLKQQVVLDYMGPLNEPEIFKGIYKFKKAYCKFINKKTYLPNADPWMLKNYARQISQKLKNSDADVVFSATSIPTAYLECDRPVVFWADATFAGLHNFYEQYTNLDESVMREWNWLEENALQKCSLAIYASDWAAKTAIEAYGADPNKVKVVPFGANIDTEIKFEDISRRIDARSSDVCKLLFLGMDWKRKGGDTAYEVAKQLNASGLKVELTVIGCTPLIPEPTPDFVKPLGFISKGTDEGRNRLRNIIMESHFLILPTLAECFGVVFCEANSLGVPCIARSIGGVPTAIRNGFNGQLFDRDADISEYCDYIVNVFGNYSEYRELAFSSWSEYHNRLSWDIAGKTVYQLLEGLL
ncbi:glycosyltransferase family 4 protein [Altericista sp. CCNU0014]|uniref:glycosyltransferase family 4 protein n=1 Tax=Altericista sp. CCNU0014 TaxID=3082949 RepID=UPI00384C6BCA